ncbi:hypothetical protein PENANT_c008G04746 [Penicillium antarcticum]|uniref:Prokaryotic-type class I peptide chain release factors domain-containing protein n=1 Tax=Penicillium antarcticum TaxID=416450 RepID=A0A1V6QAM0_9EURO|nr:uncharacterized protein N7508_007108 [Penicillium antarcticum]KAJ5302245.1 hypothetical protein N7508_007108 [Penicillium antarcticum]OQD86057.1 hypothetical protein PENANT_c008G04746 [Penicillium antarcticum]
MFPRLRGPASQVAKQIRFFSQSQITPAKALPPRLKINDADLTISYLKGTGPGGQKINKTNSACQISHKPSGVVIKCQATRSRAQNEKIARSLLADRVEAKLKGDQSRVAIKAEAARRKKASKMKKTRRKYRELEGREVGEDGRVVDEEILEEEIVEKEVENEVERKDDEGGRVVDEEIVEEEIVEKEVENEVERKDDEGGRVVDEEIVEEEIVEKEVENEVERKDDEGGRVVDEEIVEEEVEGKKETQVETETEAVEEKGSGKSV